MRNIRYTIKPDPSLPGVEPLAAQGVPGFEAYTKDNNIKSGDRAPY